MKEREVRNLTDSNLLREQVEKSGLKYQYIAEKLDLSRYGLMIKIEGKTEFKASEIRKICNILKISNDLRDLIFFAE